MSNNLGTIEEAALALSAKERARLVMDLIKSLDNYDDPEADELWIREAERRYQEYREGKLQGRPADDVYRDAFSKVQ
ncbi:MAG TPA: addiction module protein [Smithellaceae bacterium]|jgi:putative addiction module component (TIGR02574 family)|nr:addiction module protein [Smithellaceae bacterium]HQM45990.1 addiction module protein [Smithellaceae bacterium]